MRVFKTRLFHSGTNPGCKTDLFLFVVPCTLERLVPDQFPKASLSKNEICAARILDPFLRMRFNVTSLSLRTRTHLNIIERLRWHRMNKRSIAARSPRDTAARLRSDITVVLWIKLARKIDQLATVSGTLSNRADLIPVKEFDFVIFSPRADENSEAELTMEIQFTFNRFGFLCRERGEKKKRYDS